MVKFQTGETVTYRVLSSYTPASLEKIVNEHLQQGYITLGGVSVSGSSARGEEVLYQAVEKREAVYKHEFTVPFTDKELPASTGTKTPRPEANCTISGHHHKAKDCPHGKK